MSEPEQEFLTGFAAQVVEQFIARLKEEGLVHDDRPLLSVPEAAKRLGLGERTLGKLIAGEGGEPPKIASLIVAGGTRKIEPREIDRYIEEARRLALREA